MMLRFIYTLMTFALVLACATPEPPKYEFRPGARVGIINHLEGYATHRHFSSLRFDSFSKQVDVDWGIPAYIENKLSDALQAGQRYTVRRIKPVNRSGWLNQEPASSDRTAESRAMKDKLAKYLGTFGDEYQLDVIILIRSYSGPSAVRIDNQPIAVKGYGLFTRQLLMSKKAYAYANIAVEVFKTGPMTFIGSGVPQNRKSSLDNMDLEGSLKTMRGSEIQKIEPMIKDYADQAVQNALVNANLIPPGKLSSPQSALGGRGIKAELRRSQTGLRSDELRRGSPRPSSLQSA